MNRTNAIVGSSFTLDMQFSRRGANADVAAVTKVELQDRDYVVLETITDIFALGDGLYRISVPAQTTGGTRYDVWYYTPVTGAETQTETGVVVVKPFEGEAADEEEGAAEEPDSGADTTCLITGTLYRADGSGWKGATITFTPTSSSEVSGWFVAQAVETESAEDGTFSLQVLRGLVGTLSITGLGLVRTVTIPAVAEVSLADLVSSAPDLLAVQDGTFTDLPRMS